MIINKLNITAFGGIKDKAIEFKSGTNVIYGANEAGKSTICAFLEAMLYGMNKPLKNESRIDIRQKYLPWDTQTASGSMEFTVNGKNYVLERKFGKTKRSDKAVLRYGDSWEECTDFDAENIGLELLGLSEESFVKSVFMGQLATEISGKDDEILKRLSNLSSTGDEEASFGKINDILSAAKYAVIPKSTAKSIMGDLTSKKETLEREAKDITLANESVKDSIIEINSLVHKTEEIRKEIENLTKEKEKAREYEKFVSDKKIKENIKKLDERKKEHEEKIEALTKSVGDINKELTSLSEEAIKEAVLKVEDLTREKEALKLQEIKVSAEQDRLSALAVQFESVKKKSSAAGGIIMLCVSILCVVCALFSRLHLVRFVAMRLAHIMTLVPVIVSVILLTFSVFVFINAKKHKKEANKLAEEISVSEQNLAGLLKLSDNSEIEAKINEILSEFCVNSVNELKIKISSHVELKNKAELLEKELELSEKNVIQIETDIKSAKEMLSGSEECEVTRSFDEIEIEFSRKNNELLEAEKRKKELEFKIGHAYEGLRTLDVVSSELMSLEPEIEYYKSVHASLEIALSVMAECEDELKSGFTPELHGAVNEILSYLTDSRYSELKLSDDYAAQVKEPDSGTIVSALALSGGTYDLIYIAVRLGILKTVFDEKIPLLIMDDTFLQLDDERQSRAIELLQKLDLLVQSFYFTCHGDILEKYKKYDNINICIIKKEV